MCFSFVPYGRDIVRGRVKPARSARLMIMLLLMISILQQHSVGSGWLIAMTIGDTVGAVAILFLSFSRGIGGLSRIDFACYVLLTVDVLVWLSTGSALLALHLSLLADLIAMTPVFIKTWRQPWTETPLFFLLGVVAPLLNILGAGKYSYAVLLLPVYVGLVNLFEVVLIVWRQNVLPHPSRQPQTDYQPLT